MSFGPARPELGDHGGHRLVDGARVGGGRQVGLEQAALGRLLLGQIGATRGLVLLDRVDSLLHERADHTQDGLVRERFSELDFLVAHGAAHAADRLEAQRVAALHRRLHVRFQSLAQAHATPPSSNFRDGSHANQDCVC